MKRCPHCNTKLGRTGHVALDAESVTGSTITVELAACPRCGGAVEGFETRKGGT